MVPWLHCTGTQILDSYNNPYYLRGINAWMDLGDPVGLTYDDLVDISKWGFNVVRSFIYWDDLTPHDKNVETTRFTTGSSIGPALDDMIDWCDELNLYFMPSLEIGTWAQMRPPDWSDITEEPGGRSYWFGALFTNTSLVGNDYTDERESMQNIWAFMADRYRNYSNLIFDLHNEPYAFAAASYGGIAQYYLDWTNYLNQIIAAIRAAEINNHLITITTLDPRCYEPPDTCWPDVTGSDIVWCDHKYPLDREDYDEPYPGADYNFLKTKWDFDIWEATTIARYGRPVMMSEVGRRTYNEDASEPPYWVGAHQYGGDYEYTEDVFRAFGELGVVHWNWWAGSRRTLAGENFNVLQTDGTPLDITTDPGTTTFIDLIREATYKNSTSSTIADAFAMMSE